MRHNVAGWGYTVERMPVAAFLSPFRAVKGSPPGAAQGTGPKELDFQGPCN
jgi:hypothetical protein